MGETFGQWLALKRRAAGLNRAELAALARVSRATISLYELDKVRQPRKSQVDKIAKALNAPVDEARTAAGYASRPYEKPQNPAEFVAALSRMG